MKKQVSVPFLKTGRCLRDPLVNSPLFKLLTNERLYLLIKEYYSIVYKGTQLLN